jgi:hypothetical protein
VSYRDAPVEADTIPLHLLERDFAARTDLGKLIVSREELLKRFAPWVYSFQPALWKEIQHMASKATDGPRIEWDKLAEYADLTEVLRVLPLERITTFVGEDRAAQIMDPEKLLHGLVKRLSPEQFEEMLRRVRQE